VLPTDDFALRAWISRELGWHKCPAEPLAAIAEVARARPWDPWRSFLEGLTWDGVRRVDTAAVRLLGCADTEANRTTFAWWLVSAVARSLDPGCQVDHVIVLEGEQQLGKTSFLRGLAMHDAFFTRLVSGADLNAPRTIAKIHGPVIIEMAELAVMRRAEIETIKAFLDERTDRVQWLYSRKPVDVPRSCVFAASTNDSHYLRDTTGNRRFWPIRCRRIDLTALAEMREQLWAEAVALYRAGAKWWPTRDEAISIGIVEAQEERLEVEPIGDVIGEMLAVVRAPGKHPLTGVTIDAGDLDAAGRLVRASLRTVAELAGLHPVRDGAAVSRTLKLLRWTPLRTPGTASRVWIAPDRETRGTYAEAKTTCPN
jgi:predicted P-loop ATPase